MTEHPVPVETLHRLLRLNPDTGQIFWRERDPLLFSLPSPKREQECKRWNARHANKEAFTHISDEGRHMGTLLGRGYRRNLVVFAMANGRWPVALVDHKDGDPGNDRPSNLREATRRQNTANGRAMVGTSSFRGVSLHRRSGKWAVQCKSVNGRKHVGLFADEVEAARAYDAAASVAFGEFARLNFPEERRA